ncbi:outer membrane biogenesis protein BamB [Rosistilla carotiformis]|uniref:Outer membrane biogenesis protein BamB n=1 Tax=Rosistilla carotiformis TaxID=2528017 RepID=A0A518JXC8_9BACT|nr:PQQ-binding-like beta-propeller repeat protein [Rosistilla carotiformis]QDV70191.1 outer membrane biogenesis protein BamB [Rosistilla carotiformis]
MRCCLLLLLVAFHASSAMAADWLAWRGPTADNHARQGESVPTSWSETENVLWKTPVPGRGHASPILVGERIYLATADQTKGVQAVVAFNRQTGAKEGVIVVHQGGVDAKIHNKNTYASPTIASDGKQLYTVFVNNKAVWASAISLNGKILWQQRVGSFDPKKYQFGYGASPVIYRDMLIVANEYDGPDSGLYALDTKTGKPRWKSPRPQQISFSSPIVAEIAGRDQLLISGFRQIASIDPATGRSLWEAAGTTDATCGTMVWDGDLVFASGGYPDSGTFAVRGDGSGEVLWQNGVKCYEQSMLVVDGFLYGVADSGVAYCWRAADGEEMWKHRLKGPVSASPVAVGDTILASNELGTTFVFKANPERFELIAENQFGDASFASPVVVDNRLYLRHARGAGADRQEFLICIGQR